MMKFTKEWAVAALIRAIKTFAQTALGFITVGAMFSEIDWMKMLSVAGVAAVYSVLTSIVTGLPEVADVDGKLLIDDSGENTKWLLQVDTPVEDVSKQKTIKLKIDPNAQLRGKE